MATIVELSKQDLVAYWVEQVPKLGRLLGEEPKRASLAVPPSGKLSHLKWTGPDDSCAVIETEKDRFAVCREKLVTFATDNQRNLENTLLDVVKAGSSQTTLAELFTAYPKISSLIVELAVCPLPMCSQGSLYALVRILEQFDQAIGKDGVRGPLEIVAARRYFTEIRTLICATPEEASELENVSRPVTLRELTLWKSSQMKQRVFSLLSGLCERRILPSGELNLSSADIVLVSAVFISVIGLPENNSLLKFLFDIISRTWPASDYGRYKPVLDYAVRHLKNCDYKDPFRLQLWASAESSFRKYVLETVDELFLVIPEVSARWNLLVTDCISVPTLFKGLMQMLEALYWNSRGCQKIAVMAKQAVEELFRVKTAGLLDYFDRVGLVLYPLLSIFLPEMPARYQIDRLTVLQVRVDSLLASENEPSQMLLEIRWTCVIYSPTFLSWLFGSLRSSDFEMQQASAQFVGTLFALTETQRRSFASSTTYDDCAIRCEEFATKWISKM